MDKNYSIMDVLSKAVSVADAAWYGSGKTNLWFSTFKDGATHVLKLEGTVEEPSYECFSAYTNVYEDDEPLQVYESRNMEAYHNRLIVSGKYPADEDLVAYLLEKYSGCVFKETGEPERKPVYVLTSDGPALGYCLSRNPEERIASLRYFWDGRLTASDIQIFKNEKSARDFLNSGQTIVPRTWKVCTYDPRKDTVVAAVPEGGVSHA